MQKRGVFRPSLTLVDESVYLSFTTQEETLLPCLWDNTGQGDDQETILEGHTRHFSVFRDGPGAVKDRCADHDERIHDHRACVFLPSTTRLPFCVDLYLLV